MIIFNIKMEFNTFNHRHPNPFHKKLEFVLEVEQGTIVGLIRGEI